MLRYILWCVSRQAIAMVTRQGQGFATLFFLILQKIIKFAMAMLISG